MTVGTILEGSVRKEETQIRITTQLINATDGNHLWSRNYDRQLEDIFAIQDDIATSVAEALNVTLLGQVRQEYKPKPAAYNAYMQGRYLITSRNNKEDLQKAKKYFDQAIQIDPKYSLALVRLSDVSAVSVQRGYISRNEGLTNSRFYLQKALQLEPDSPVALTRLGWMQLSYDWNWSAAESTFKRAMTLDPNSPAVLSWSSTLQAVLGHVDEAIRLNQRSLESDPLVIQAHFNQGDYFYSASRFREAEVAYKKVLELNSEYFGAHASLGMVYLAQHKKKESLDEVLKEGDEQYRLAGLAIVFCALAKSNEADRVLNEIIKKHNDEMKYQIAEIYAYRDEFDKAFDWLERAYQQHDSNLLGIKMDLFFRNLHRDPRWNQLLKKMKLPT